VVLDLAELHRLEQLTDGKHGAASSGRLAPEGAVQVDGLCSWTDAMMQSVSGEERGVAVSEEGPCQRSARRGRVRGLLDGAYCIADRIMESL